jgi:hypothetical protein
MVMNKETGGPAFPFSVMTYQPDHPESPRYTTTWHDGMTLRDYFAAKAMQALIDNDGLFSEIPTQAYALADAMMKAREA